MRLFRTHSEVARATTRTVSRFFVVAAVGTGAFAVLVAGHYLLGWW